MGGRLGFCEGKSMQSRIFVMALDLMMKELYAEERDEETGSRSLAIADLNRFRSLRLVEKVFAVLVVILVIGITVGIALMLGVAFTR